MAHKIFYGWWIVLAGSLLTFYISSIVFFGFTAFFEPLVTEFGWSYIRVSFATRLVAPSSERAAHVWLQRMTGVEDLLETDNSDLSQDRVYKVSDMLLRRKTEIEEHLRVKECRPFNLEETILLYDLTNTLIFLCP